VFQVTLKHTREENILKHILSLQACFSFAKGESISPSCSRMSSLEQHNSNSFVKAEPGVGCGLNAHGQQLQKYPEYGLLKQVQYQRLPPHPQKSRLAFVIAFSGIPDPLEEVLSRDDRDATAVASESTRCMSVPPISAADFSLVAFEQQLGVSTGVLTDSRVVQLHFVAFCWGLFGSLANLSVVGPQRQPTAGLVTSSVPVHS